MEAMVKGQDVTMSEFTNTTATEIGTKMGSLASNG
jgi:hypothetical protein